MKSALRVPSVKKLAYALPIVNPALVELSQAGDLARYRSKRARLLMRTTDIGDIDPPALMCADAPQVTTAVPVHVVSDPVILHLWTADLSEFEPSSGALRVVRRCISLVAGSSADSSWVKLATTEPGWEERLL